MLGAVLIAALAIADVTIYSALRASLFNNVDQLLEKQSSYLVGRPFCPSPFAGRFGGAGLNRGGEAGPGPGSPGPALISTPYQSVVDLSDDTVVFSCAADVGGHSYSPKLPSSISGLKPSSTGTAVTYFSAPSKTAGGPEFEVRAAALPNGTEVIVATPITDTDNTLNRLLLIELGVTAGAVLAALVAGWWLVRLGLRPLIEVERTAENIAAGDLQHRVPNDTARSEVGRLARTLNVMLERIEAAFAARVASEERLKVSDRRLRQFVSDASHELRTPISAVSAYAELFGRGAADNEEDLARVMEGIRSETARMERLVADLLTLARLDEGQPLDRVSIELVTLCSEAIETARTVAPGWPVHLSADQPVEVEGDPHRVRQVLDNLLANVRSHTPLGTPTEVRVREEHNEAVIVVADSGPGLPEDQAARVFERFFRADPSRSRTRGGAGLGLSIVEAIVTAHHGSVAATSAPGQGMTVTIRLPAVAEDHEPDDDNGDETVDETDVASDSEPVPEPLGVEVSQAQP